MGLKSLIGGALLGGGALYFAQQYHVLQHADGLAVVSRTQQPSLSAAYLDVRGWGASQWSDYPDVAAALVASDRADLMYGSAAPGGDLSQPLQAAPAGLPAPGALVPTAPPIQFDPALSHSASILTTPQAGGSGTGDGSLISRLTRQLEQQRTLPAGHSPATTAPAATAPAGTAPASHAAPTNWVAPLPEGQTRAGATPPPQDAWQLPLHATGLERGSTNSSTGGTLPVDPAEAAPPVTNLTGDFFSTLQQQLPLQQSAGGSATPLSQMTQQVTDGLQRSLIPAAVPGSATESPPWAAGPTGQQLPAALQEQFRALTPSGPSAESTGWLESL